VILVKLVEPVLGNSILGRVDIVIHEPASWRFVFRNCPWRRDAQGEYLLMPGGVPFELLGDDATNKFQDTAIRALHEHVLSLPLATRERKRLK
jgi:hypothetical protein